MLCIFQVPDSILHRLKVCMSSQGFCTYHFIDASGYTHNLYYPKFNSNLTLDVEIVNFLGWLHLSLDKWPLLEATLKSKIYNLALIDA